jgi:hypothetical protein
MRVGHPTSKSDGSNFVVPTFLFLHQTLLCKNLYSGRAFELLIGICFYGQKDFCCSSKTRQHSYSAPSSLRCSKNLPHPFPETLLPIGVGVHQSSTAFIPSAVLTKPPINYAIQRILHLDSKLTSLSAHNDVRHCYPTTYVAKHRMISISSMKVDHGVDNLICCCPTSESA